MWPSDKQLPLIHVYGFIKGSDQDLLQLAQNRIRLALPYFNKDQI